MNMCRETFPQLLSFYPGNALLTADGRGRGGEERDGGRERERHYLFAIWSSNSEALAKHESPMHVIQVQLLRELTELL